MSLFIRLKLESAFFILRAVAKERAPRRASCFEFLQGINEFVDGNQALEAVRILNGPIRRLECLHAEKPLQAVGYYGFLHIVDLEITALIPLAPFVPERKDD